MAPAPTSRAIVHLAAECFPFARTGGLAEAVHGLATAQAAAGETVHVLLPLHRPVRAAADTAPAAEPFEVQVGPRREWARLWHVGRPTEGAPRIWAIENETYFGRDGIYGDSHGDFGDNPARFACFCRAALRATAALHDGPTLLHLHDWHTALAAIYLRVLDEHATLAARSRVVLTVHNPGYQGHFPAAIVPTLGLPWSLYDWRALEWYGQVNLLKGGVAHADEVVTVSPRQAEELLTPEGGFGLHEVFRALGPRLGGILNGIDQRVWDPARDPQIAARFDADDPAGKRACKRELQQRFGLPARDDVPVFGFAGRLVAQKGLALLLEARDLLATDAQFVFLGTGERRYADGIAELARWLPGRVALHHGFTDGLEHALIAGSDALLMPSRYEPCGLTQMRAQRYGTLPLVRQVGGLADTVDDGATGFSFGAFAVEAFGEAASRALATWRNPTAWRAMMRTAMRRDFSWSGPTARYLDVYARTGLA